MKSKTTKFILGIILPVVMVLALVVPLAVPMPASAAALVGVTNTPTNAQAGATTVHTVVFTTAAGVPAFGTIQVQYPAGFNVAGATLTSVTGSITPVLVGCTLGVSGQTITITIAAVPLVAETVTVVLGSIVNTTTSGIAYKVTVATSVPDGPTDSANFSIIPGATFSPIAGPIGTTITAGGPGWAPGGETITAVTVVGVAVVTPGNLTVNGTGVLSGTILVPAGVAGAGSIVITGSGSGARTFANVFTQTAFLATYTPVTGPAGTTLTITVGTGWATAVDTNITATVGGVLAADTLAIDAAGVLTGTITVPAQAAGAGKTVVITAAISGAQTSATTFTVTPSATFVPISGPIGTTITAGGPGWAAGGETITAVTVVGVAVVTPGNLTVTAGVLSGTILVPAGVAGAGSIVITGSGSGAQTYANAFTGTTALAVFTPVTGPPGTVLTISGAQGGWATIADTNITVTVGGVLAADTLAIDATGVLTGTITVPAQPTGAGLNVVITAATSGVQTFAAVYAVTPAATFTPILGPVGTVITVTGGGWATSAPVTAVTVGGQAVVTPGNLTINAAGTMAGTITIPAGINIGANTIIITATGNGAVTLGATFQGIIPVTFTPIAGAYNTVITVAGTGWTTPSDTITAVTVGGVAVVTPGNLTVNGTGVLSGTITVPIGAAAGLGNITITGTGTPIQTYTGAFTVVTNAIYLGTGWNLFSYPLVPANTLIGTVLTGISANVNAVWYYDPSFTPTFWRSWSPVVGPIYTLTTIEDGKAYWIDMTAPATLAVAGTIQPAPPVTPRAYPVVVGWNMIGYKSNVNPVAFRTNTVYLGAAILANVQRMYKFDNAAQAWLDVTAAGTNWNPGEGWWISTTTAGTIFP